MIYRSTIKISSGDVPGKRPKSTECRWCKKPIGFHWMKLPNLSIECIQEFEDVIAEDEINLSWIELCEECSREINKAMKKIKDRAKATACNNGLAAPGSSEPSGPNALT